MKGPRQLYCANGHQVTVQPWADHDPLTCPACPLGVPCNLPLSTRPTRQKVAL